jgi:hypothetical protein
MSFKDGLADVALGIGCILAAPLVVATVAEIAIVVGTVAVLGGVTTVGSAATAGATAMIITESATTTIGTGIALNGVDKVISK